MYDNFEISLVAFMPNITSNHAINYTDGCTCDPTLPSLLPNKRLLSNKRRLYAVKIVLDTPL